MDTVVPTISTEAITSVTGLQNNLLNQGDVLTATVNFSETVVKTGEPRLALNIGGSTVYAAYSAGSGTSALTFTYTIQSGQTDDNGISIPLDALELNGGTIKDQAGNIATITKAAVTSNASYMVDTTLPATPTIDVLASSDNGASSTDNISSIATPQVLVTLGAGLVAGDIVTLKAGAAAVGSFTLTATEISNGNVNIAASALGAQGTYVLNADVTDAAGNVSASSGTISYVLDSSNDAPTVSLVTSTSSSITILAADVDAEPNWTNLVLVNSLNGSSAVNDGTNTTFTVAAQSTVTQVNMSVADGTNETSITQLGNQVAVVLGTSLGESIAPAEGKAGIYFGFQGNDTIYGSTGSDVIWGGSNKDVMTGDYDPDETGARSSDTFAFAAGDSGIISSTMFDTILDYSAGIAGDKLDLVGAATGAANTSATDVATASGNPGQSITASISNGVLSVAGGNAGQIDSLTEWLAVSRTMNTVDSKVVAFQFSGDTYVFQENTGGDLLILLDNVTDITGLATSSAANTILLG